jgi:hypothetical protein
MDSLCCTHRLCTRIPAPCAIPLSLRVAKTRWQSRLSLFLLLPLHLLQRCNRILLRKRLIKSCMHHQSFSMMPMSLSIPRSALLFLSKK